MCNYSLIQISEYFEKWEFKFSRFYCIYTTYCNSCIFQLLDEFTQVLLQDLQNKDGNVPNPEKLDKQQVSFSFFTFHLRG